MIVKAKNVHLKEQDMTYYDKDDQYITISSRHAVADGGDNKRIWWNDADDIAFTNFADKCLATLIDAPYKDFKGFPFPEESGEQSGFCNANQTKGWVVSLRRSNDINRSLTSFCIVTVLNFDSDTMNKNLPLFVKYDDTYIINIDKPYKPVIISKEDALKKELEEVNIKVSVLVEKYDDAYLEYECETDEKLKKQKKKEFVKIDSQLTQLKNRLENLRRTINE